MSEEERIGVYVCHCGTNISHTVDVEEVTKYAATLPNVVIAREYKYMCSDPGQDLVKDDIKELKLNRVVVASCSPLMHEGTFRRACADAGLNQFLFQMANIREHCSWVHADKAQATLKAKRLIKAAVNRVDWQEPLDVKEVPVNPATLVVGGGITGIEAALQIANSGKKVYLVERDPSIGGHMARFDKTFPTLDCAACILTPKMVSVGQHPNIDLLAYSEVEEVSGFVGNFKVKVRKKAKSVHEELCTGCGLCSEKCPAKAPSEFEEGLGERKAIYTPFPQAVPRIPVIDREHCRFFQTGKCGICQKLCPRGAVDYEQQDEFLDLEVGAIILATGFQLFDARRANQFGYGKLDNVITALEFERYSHASGPTGGNIVLKDGRTPEAVAILHCIGSRDENYNEYCSRVCCMYSMKFAHLIKEKTNAKVYEFYIDVRAFGKGYEEFYKRMLREDVIFIRGKGAEITDVAETPAEKGKLIVRAEDTLLGVVRRIPVDMVVLSGALEPAKGALELARTFSVSRSKDGFLLEKHLKLAPVETASDGIYIAGCCQSPKDIPDCVAQGAAAAAVALSLIDRGKVKIEPIVSQINPDRCAGCKICITACPYAAISYDEEKKVSVVEEAVCKGCGTCVSACPAGAAMQQGFTGQQIDSEIEGVLTEALK
jgi:heterodisulfide reductase subunit A2